MLFRSMLDVRRGDMALETSLVSRRPIFETEPNASKVLLLRQMKYLANNILPETLCRGQVAKV